MSLKWLLFGFSVWQPFKCQISLFALTFILHPFYLDLLKAYKICMMQTKETQVTVAEWNSRFMPSFQGWNKDICKITWNFKKGIVRHGAYIYTAQGKPICISSQSLLYGLSWRLWLKILQHLGLAWMLLVICCINVCSPNSNKMSTNCLYQATENDPGFCNLRIM